MMPRYLIPIVLLFVLLPRPVVAQDDERAGVEVEIVGAEGEDREALESAASAGLEEGAGVDPTGTLTIEVKPDGEIVLRYRSEAGSSRARRADAPAEVGERTTMVTLLVRSLMDDEASQLLDALAAPAPVDEEPAPMPPAEIIVIPHVVDVVEEPVADAPAVEAPAEAAPELTHIPVAIDFAPYVGVSSATRGSDLRNFSLGAVGDLYGALTGVAIGGVVSLGASDVTGLQIGGVFAMAPRSLTGVQIGGVLGLAGQMKGAQVGFVNVVTDDAKGAQLGFVNVGAAAMAGTQIGFVNYVHDDLAGVQIGFVNVADEADLGIGLVNIYPNGRTHVSANGDTSGFVQAELSHGSRYVHNIVVAGANPFHSDAAPVLGGGIGGVIPLGPHVDLSIDGLFRLTLRNLDQGTYDLLPGARATFAFSIVDGVALTAGASYTVQVTNDPFTPDYGNLLGWVHQPYDGFNTVRSYVAFSGGVRFF